MLGRDSSPRRRVYPRQMLVYDFIHIPMPVAQVRDRLLSTVPNIWQEAAAAAYDEGEDLLSRVGPFGPVPGLSKAVSVHVSNVRVRGEAFVVQLRWSASGPTELFPVMEADLEIAPMGARQSQLGFSGSYDPPLGSFGRQLDRLLCISSPRPPYAQCCASWSRPSSWSLHPSWPPPPTSSAPNRNRPKHPTSRRKGRSAQSERPSTRRTQSVQAQMR